MIIDFRLTEQMCRRSDAARAAAAAYDEGSVNETHTYRHILMKEYDPFIKALTCEALDLAMLLSAAVRSGEISNAHITVCVPEPTGGYSHTMSEFCCAMFTQGIFRDLGGDRGDLAWRKLTEDPEHRPSTYAVATFFSNFLAGVQDTSMCQTRTA